MVRQARAPTDPRRIPLPGSPLERKRVTNADVSGIASAR